MPKHRSGAPERRLNPQIRKGEPDRPEARQRISTVSEQDVTLRIALKSLSRFFLLLFVIVLLVLWISTPLSGLGRLLTAFALSLLATVVIGLLVKPKKLSTILASGGVGVLLAAAPAALPTPYVEIGLADGTVLRVGYETDSSLAVFVSALVFSALLFGLAYVFYRYVERR